MNSSDDRLVDHNFNKYLNKNTNSYRKPLFTNTIFKTCALEISWTSMYLNLHKSQTNPGLKLNPSVCVVKKILLHHDFETCFTLVAPPLRPQKIHKIKIIDYNSILNLIIFWAI